MTNLATEVRITVTVTHLDDAAVTASTHACIEVASAEETVARCVFVGTVTARSGELVAA